MEEQHIMLQCKLGDAAVDRTSDGEPLAAQVEEELLHSAQVIHTVNGYPSWLG
jgi:hypothetical protein